MTTTDKALAIAGLKAKINTAFTQIKEEKIFPKDTGIIKFLDDLHALDAAEYKIMFDLYKPISTAYFAEYNERPDVKKAREAKRKKDIDAALRLKFTGGDGPGKAGREKKVREPKVKAPKAPKQPKVQKEKGNRDRSGYTFNGEQFGKGQLVLAIVKHHVTKNPGINLSQLKAAFPDTLLKGYGILQEHSKAIEISKVRKRFFLNDSQLVKINGGSVAICNQFSSDNIHPFLEHARKLGYKID